MKNLLPDLVIYEVTASKYDAETGECTDEVDSTYVVTPASLRAETIVDISRLPTEGLKVQIYEARTATIYYDKGKIELEDVDTSTGYNGSPIWERCYELPEPPLSDDVVILSEEEEKEEEKPVKEEKKVSRKKSSK